MGFGQVFRLAMHAAACLAMIGGSCALAEEHKALDGARQLATLGALSPAQEKEGFRVPDGFEVELVLAETTRFGKFVSLAFDRQGRLWTMTAMEYPVDANENPSESARLFANGGRDCVLIVDRACDKQPARPRVFVDGLVMPLGILPYRDGAFVQYGSEIRFYRDIDGDGRADRHEPILLGFGTEDSHLFPHQFTRVAGGHVLMAQGLFNSSKVRRPGGEPFVGGATSVPFNHCKLARFRLDGTDFEALTAGPNNIWGLTISREGETWIQEANDLGFPIIPYQPGGYYPTGSTERLRPYQPLMPAPLGPAQMGGTGLSGLALSDDANGWPAPFGMRGATADSPRVFYVANPITSSIQVIHAQSEGERYRYSKQPDFLTSADSRFRPVAIQFGPDGCLYVVDWYNKIISHNEVPRTHPQRDKSSGRIWRIRHKSQTAISVPNLAQCGDRELLEHLGDPNARIADFAWQEIVDRQSRALVASLEEIATDRAQAADKRIGALWALEGLSAATAPVLAQVAGDLNPNLRVQAVRIAGAQLAERDYLAIAESLIDDRSHRVRAAVGDSLRRRKFRDERGVALMMRLGAGPISGDEWDVYEREFERFLARWAMEVNRDSVAMYLQSPAGMAQPLENRVLASLALEGPTAAGELAKLIPQLDRQLNDEEIRVLASHAEDAAVADALRHAIEQHATRKSTLDALLKIRTSIDVEEIAKILTPAMMKLWDEDTSTEGREQWLEVAGAYEIEEAESRIVALALSRETAPDLARGALRALRELDSSDVRLMELITREPRDRGMREEAIEVLAESGAPETGRALLALWDELNFRERPLVVERLARHRSGCEALLGAWEDGDIDSLDIPVESLEQIRDLLPNHPDVESLWSEMSGRLGHVLRLSGADEDAGPEVSLTGPFTVESWVELAPEIGNVDSLLGADGVLDMNFHDGRFRVWVAGGQHDIVVSERPALAGSWNHYAVTRDEQGTFRIYLNGEPVAQSAERNTNDFPRLRLGQSIAAGGSDARFAEFRVWNVARTGEQIRESFDRTFAGDERPESLIQCFGDRDWGELLGRAEVEPALDAPQLLSADQAQEREAKFARYRHLANSAGDRSAGQALFAKHCLTCHQHRGEGGKIGPALDGVGLTGTEALLRNILTPNAAMEGGYRSFRVVTHDGRIIDGLLVSNDEEAIVLRQPNTADIRIATGEIARAGFTPLSVMPEGLLESLGADEVTDLFAYLKSLGRE